MIAQNRREGVFLKIGYTNPFDGWRLLAKSLPYQLAKITFTPTNSSGNWGSDAAVLTFNSDGYHVAAHEYTDLHSTIGGISNTFLVTDDVVSLPPTVLLLGSGLLGLMGLEWRRNKKN